MRRVVLMLSALVLLSAIPAAGQLDQILKEMDTYARSGVALPGRLSKRTGVARHKLTSRRLPS